MFSKNIILENFHLVYYPFSWIMFNMISSGDPGGIP